MNDINLAHVCPYYAWDYYLFSSIIFSSAWLTCVEMKTGAVFVTYPLTNTQQGTYTDHHFLLRKMRAADIDFGRAKTCPPKTCKNLITYADEIIPDLFAPVMGIAVNCTFSLGISTR